MYCCVPSDLDRLAASLAAGLRLELTLTPKPGLVDLLDNGSHPDLSLPRMIASIDLVETYLKDLAALLSQGAGLGRLVEAGRRAEERMLSRLGTNTHRGAIFLMGLLLTARARCGSDDPDFLRPALKMAAEEFFSGFPPSGSHGAKTRRDYRVGGVVAEALGGLPSLFDIALPAYLHAFPEHGPGGSAFAMMGALMRAVEDTTTLYRGGPLGLARLRADGERLQKALEHREDPFPLLLELNRDYRRLNLTMGGVADILALAFGWLHYTGALVPETAWSGFSVDTPVPQMTQSAPSITP